MNKSEILFYYEVKDCNPNGDPLEADMPRNDAEHILVSDVRLKRTIRDYWDRKAKEGSKTYFMPKKKDDGTLYLRRDVFNEIKNEVKESGEYKQCEKKSDELLNRLTIEQIFKDFIDMRLFGAVFALDKEENKGRNYNFTGAVQFAIGRSKHKAVIKQLKGTTVMPSGESKGQGTFTNRYIVPYALIEFYGIINPNSNYPENLKHEEELFKKDISYLFEGIWEGTKNLITRSKFGHKPVFIIKINYKDDRHIGMIGAGLTLTCKEKEELRISEKDIRSCEDYDLNFNILIEKIKKANEQKMIESVGYRVNENFNGFKEAFIDKLKQLEIKVEEIKFDFEKNK